MKKPLYELDGKEKTWWEKKRTGREFFTDVVSIMGAVALGIAAKVFLREVLEVSEFLSSMIFVILLGAILICWRVIRKKG